jgi:peptidyl-tRNA hydrolase
MTPGKMASQASHAAVQASLDCLGRAPDRFKRYQDGTFGTKVVLHADELKMRWLFELATERQIPCALIEDSGHAAFHDGRPTTTALGIGPIQRHEMRELKKLELVK